MTVPDPFLLHVTSSPIWLVSPNHFKVSVCDVPLVVNLAWTVTGIATRLSITWAIGAPPDTPKMLAVNTILPKRFALMFVFRL